MGEAQKRWRERNPEWFRKWRKEWRRKHPEKVRAEYHARMSKDGGAKEKARCAKYRADNPERLRAIKLRKFGLTLADYDAMFEVQGGLCAICLQRNIENRRLAVDHDHRSGKVRGLLCGSCNKALGLFRDSPQILTAALAYLLKGVAPKDG